MSDQIYYIDSKGRKYKGQIIICKNCKTKKIVRIYSNRKILGYCKNCYGGRRKTDIKKNETFIDYGENKGRKQRIRAFKTKCDICSKIYLRKKCDIYKTKICHDCICEFNGKKSYKNGIGIYHKETLNKKEKKCEFCNQTDIVIVHHIDLDRTNNHQNNLTVLCHSCHITVHWRIRKGMKPLEAFEEVKKIKKPQEK